MQSHSPLGYSPRGLPVWPGLPEPPSDTSWLISLHVQGGKGSPPFQGRVGPQAQGSLSPRPHTRPHHNSSSCSEPRKANQDPEKLHLPSPEEQQLWTPLQPAGQPQVQHGEMVAMPEDGPGESGPHSEACGVLNSSGVPGVCPKVLGAQVYPVRVGMRGARLWLRKPLQLLAAVSAGA